MIHRRDRLPQSKGVNQEGGRRVATEHKDPNTGGRLSCSAVMKTRPRTRAAPQTYKVVGPGWGRRKECLRRKSRGGGEINQHIES